VVVAVAVVVEAFQPLEFVEIAYTLIAVAEIKEDIISNLNFIPFVANGAYMYHFFLSVLPHSSPSLLSQSQSLAWKGLRIDYLWSHHRLLLLLLLLNLLYLLTSLLQ
jgi:hypothetical protein